jgi:tetraacyldisaccharide 4'-kinase
MIVRMLLESEEWGGKNIAVLSRGYKRKSKGFQQVTVDGTAEDLGDEPLQIKRKFPQITVAVDKSRKWGCRFLSNPELLQTSKKARRCINKDIPKADIIVLDDAFQHRYAKAGLNILLIDSNRPVWRDNVIPFGRLRETPSGIKRADIVIMTKCKGMTGEQKEECRRYIKAIKEIPVYFSTICYGKPYHLFGSKLANTEIGKESSVLLITGIANPQPLKAEIERLGARTELMQYGDHHNFTTAELDDIAGHFSKNRHTMIVTTEKDATRITQRKDLPQIVRDNIYALPIEVRFMDGEEKLFNENIYDYVTENSRDC